jgi:zinc protease
MIVITEEAHDLPLVDAYVLVRRGPADDPIGREGLARHAIELVKCGAGARPREELEAAFEELGASLDAHVTSDAVGLGFRVLSANADAAVTLLADVLARPRLEEAEHARLVRESLATLDDLRDDDSSLCTRFFDRAALTGHPYGRTAFGTAASLAALTRDDAARWWTGSLGAGEVIVGFAGDLDRARADALAARLTADLRLSAAPLGAPPPIATPGGGRRTILVDKPERAQSQILIGHGCLRAADPDYLALHVGATVFGGMFTSRLMTEVRVKRGWSYGASARVGRARGGASFKIRVFPSAEQTPETLALVLGLFDELVAKGVTADEVVFATSYLAGTHAFDIDTASERLDRRMDALLWDLPHDPVIGFRERLAAISVEQVNAAIRKWLRPADATITVTCTADEMAPRLAGLPVGDVRVEPFDSY